MQHSGNCGQLGIQSPSDGKQTGYCGYAIEVYKPTAALLFVGLAPKDVIHNLTNRFQPIHLASPRFLVPVRVFWPGHVHLLQNRLPISCVSPSSVFH